MQTPPKLLIKNMVCQRCIMTVEQLLRHAGIPFVTVAMGEVQLERKLNSEELDRLAIELSRVGFELIETRLKKTIEDIKLAVIEYLTHASDNRAVNLSQYITERVPNRAVNLSQYITERVPNEYSYLSDLFSSVEGKTIEQFFILQRLERVKELLVYDQLSLTQIAWETGFSSVHHLSAQFKKMTGLSPSHFKKEVGNRRTALDLL